MTVAVGGNAQAGIADLRSHDADRQDPYQWVLWATFLAASASATSF